ncbi:MAG: dehydrogenase [Gammaproteobacteria bacterium]|nr:MAG: dehydrogenase [Gammaproteobacteria bacterium]
MKTIVTISLGSSEHNYDFRTTFLNTKFRLVRLGTDHDPRQALALVEQWKDKADAIGLGLIRDHYRVGTQLLHEPFMEALEEAAGDTPITAGTTLREILMEWSIRHTQVKEGNFFNNAVTLFFNGLGDYRAATILQEYTDNLYFADPVMQVAAPACLGSLGQLEAYAQATHPLLKYTPAHIEQPRLNPGSRLNRWALDNILKKSHVIVGPYEAIEHLDEKFLAKRTVITSTISEERLEALRQKGVYTVIDYTPQLFKHPVGIGTLEAMICAATERNPKDLTHDDYLEIIDDLEIEPRVLFPNGHRRVNRFAFVIHPLSQRYLTKAKPLALLSKVAPQVVMDQVERTMAYAPPFVYSKVDGIVSPTGAEAEGWLITVGGTPKEILRHSPEFTYRRLLAAADMAKKMGAQIMGLGAFTKVVGDAGVTVAKRAPLPITTGNSYSASGALWAAYEACKKLGFVEISEKGKIRGKAMVVGATGAIGSVCARLLAKAVEEVHLVAPEPAKLLALKESILQETPDARLELASRTERSPALGDMDMIVTATSGAGKRILDIMKVKPGCVITDVARPLDIPPEDVAKRPDVLVIESGEIELPGDVRMKDIGLPPKVAYACLAETIVLALEGRFENFTLGRQIEWEKVREIYKMGLKHGMKLAAISGVNGVYMEEDFRRVRELALKARKEEAEASEVA